MEGLPLFFFLMIRRPPRATLFPYRRSSDLTDKYADDMDELDYAIRLRMMQDAAQETVTLRHDARGRAVPLRRYASFLPGSGVGGAGEHSNRESPKSKTDVLTLD